MSDDDKPMFDRRAFLKASGTAGAVAALGGVTVATPGREPGPKHNEVLVGVSAGAGEPKAVAARHAPAEAAVVHQNETLRYAAVEFPEQAPASAMENYVNAVTDVDGVKYAEQNGTYETQYTPNDPRFGDQYAPQMVNAPTAWDTTTGSSNVTIAVVDTGAQYDHPDLDATFRSDPGYDFVDDDSDPYPDDSSSETHATHVSGIAAGETDDGTGIAGVSDCTLINGRALDETGSGSWSDVADAIEWAADQGADVINMSLGGTSDSSTVRNAVSYAHDNGCLLVAAAGNSGGDVANHYPAAYSEVMAISGIDSSGSFYTSSNKGEEIDVCAPAVQVLSSIPTDSYAEYTGTSMAAPVVSGVAGLALTEYDLTNVELRSHLKNTAVDIGLSADEQGDGRADAANAVQTAPSACGDAYTDTHLHDELSGSSDSDCWMREWEYDKPCRVRVELTGPSDADFDLFVNEGSGTCPGWSNYDYGSWSLDSRESVVIDNPDDSAPLFVTVDSYSGSGSYSLTITEEGT